MKGIIWLASYPKSGNTWLRAFIANLLADTDEPLPLAALSKFAPSEASTYWYRAFFGADFPCDDDARVAAKRAEVQKRIVMQAQKPVLLKTHSYLGQAHGHEMLDMDLTISAVYVVRNPLDVAISAAPHFNKTLDGSIKMISNEQTFMRATDKVVFEQSTDWSTHVRSWTQQAHPGLLVVRYEDMLLKPEKTFTRIARFIANQPTKKQIARAVRHASFKSLQKMEKQEGFSEGSKFAKAFFRKGKADQWKDTLTEAQIRTIVDAHKEQMKRFGYIPKGY